MTQRRLVLKDWIDLSGIDYPGYRPYREDLRINIVKIFDIFKSRAFEILGHAIHAKNGNVDENTVVGVGPRRFELPTSRLSAGRSNQAKLWAHMVAGKSVIQ